MLAQRDHEPRPQCIVRRDDQDRVHADTGADAVTATGKSTVKTAPPASRLVALMRAPWVWAMEAQMASPRPEPRSLVEKNGSKTRSRSSGGTPGPVSTTATIARSAVVATSTLTMPSGAVTSCAFIRRLRKRDRKSVV